MRIALIILCLLASNLMIAQQSSFILSNGIEVSGQIHGYTRDSITLLTPEGKLVTFAMHEISTKNQKTRSERIFNSTSKKWYIQTSLGLGFSGYTESFFTGVRLEVEGLYRPYQKMYGMFTMQTGYELLQGVYPASLFPISVGYQGLIAKWPGNEIHWNGRLGYGIGLNDSSIYDWERRDIDGGLRYEFGLLMMPALQGNTAFRLGASILFQRVDYFIETDWARQDIHQTFRRFFIHAGIVF